MVEEFAVDYVVLPNGRIPAREFIDELGDMTAARINAFIDRLGAFGTRMQGKFVEKLTPNLFELRIKHRDRIFRILSFTGPEKLS